MYERVNDMNMINEKTIFEPAKIEVITFEAEDIITTSGLLGILGEVGFEGEDDFFDLMRLINE